ncbi:hypothetical protein HPB50_019928 [Hyalomma asiaticum]|uniref:Uncharacterized protein n=1 Tax=Hyalomma asiaticum TaxID=266040 RepID=A0ACB7RQU5_HYAAI|nr:hypothetical protein HPB50_019928 [Hyalomma asiaticum]
MALRIAVGCCIFGAAWYAVDYWQPGLLPRVDVAGKIAALRDGRGHETRSANHEAESSPQGYSSTELKWKAMQDFWMKEIMDRLIPREVQILLRGVRKDMQSLQQWMSDAGYDKICLLLSSIVCLLFATWCCGSGAKVFQNNIETSQTNPAQATTVGWKSNFSVSEMAQANMHLYRHEGGYIYSRGEAGIQLRREDAAAATIQQWTRTVFKRWIEHRAPSRSSIDTPPLNSKRCIDDDYGAFNSTILEDPSVGVDALGPPECELRSPTKLGSEERPSEMEGKGGDAADSGQVSRCRKGLSLSSANLSKALLKLKPCTPQRPPNSPVSLPP